jgi:hypothetical protein
MRFMLATLLLFAAPPPRYFVVCIVDSETGRGVPLISLKLPNEVVYWTDSAGVIAMDEPSLVGRQVYAEVTGHGYRFTGKTVLGLGVMLRVEPGQTKTLEVERDILAERLYRLTGEGIYRDSLLAGLPLPLQDSFPEAQVMGQDTVSAALYRGRIFWIWGDTIGPSFFNGQVTAATSDPKDDPSIGVHYHYFTANGRVKGMLPLPRKGLVWIEGLFTVTDPSGAERLLATYTRQDGLKFPDECGLALFDDRKEVFEPFSELPCTRDHTSSHPFLHDGYWYLYPFLRVPNRWDAVREPARWEKREIRLPANLPADRNRPASIAWNAYRQRFLMLMDFGGDVYYSEAKAPEGPYSPAVKIIWQDDYTFYNVATHPFFNQDGGRIIYFEGTYTDSFSDAKVKTPRYNYNQVMYRLRLDHPGLKSAQEP